MIPLTLASDGPVLVNPGAIHQVRVSHLPDIDATDIYLAGGGLITVRETFAEVQELLEEAAS